MEGNNRTLSGQYAQENITVLAVDDDAIILKMIDFAVKKRTSYTLVCVQSGEEALSYLSRNSVNVALLDVEMPVMDGIETMKALKQLNSKLNANVPVIMLTANAMIGARDEYLKEGFIDYLSKPIRGARLENMLIKYLPQAKVSKTDAAAAKQEVANNLSLDELGKLLPELDIATGKAFCADDEDFYRTILADYAAAARDKNLEKYYAEKDLKSYQIEAHSLKSSSKMIGLNDMYEMCLALELAAKKGDVEYIKAHHSEVVERYRKIVAVLTKMRQ